MDGEPSDTDELDFEDEEELDYEEDTSGSDLERELQHMHEPEETT